MDKVKIFLIFLHWSSMIRKEKDEQSNEGNDANNNENQSSKDSLYCEACIHYYEFLSYHILFSWLTKRQKAIFKGYCIQGTF
jgi:hypothetical protein